MIGVNATTWLDLWDRVSRTDRRHRRRELLLASGPLTASEVDELEVGTANARLLQLHRSMFGSQLHCFTKCPKCQSELEVTVDAAALLRQPTSQQECRQLVLDEWVVSFRLPTEGDVETARAQSDFPTAESTLVGRCVTICRRSGEEVGHSLIPRDVLDRLFAQLEDSDPLASLDFELHCARCSHAWTSCLEPDTFVWTRLNAWVHRLANDVHILANAYGWSEREIVQMSPRRRQLYLDRVAA